MFSVSKATRKSHAVLDTASIGMIQYIWPVVVIVLLMIETTNMSCMHLYRNGMMPSF